MSEKALALIFLNLGGEMVKFIEFFSLKIKLTN